MSAASSLLALPCASALLQAQKKRHQLWELRLIWRRRKEQLR
jgi:hypothetical protein